MALVRKNPNAVPETGPADDTPKTTVQAEASASAAATPAPAPAETATPAPAPTTVTAVGHGKPSAAGQALARAGNGAGGAVAALASGSLNPVLNGLKDVVAVEFDTLNRLKAGPGNIQDNDGNNYGRQIELLLVSWQDSYDLSPGVDDDDAKEHVRYSDDGVTVKDTGELCTEYLATLRELGFGKANMKKKAVLVGILEAVENDEAPAVKRAIGGLVSVSLSSQARKSFDRYNLSRTVQVRMGKKPAEGSERILLTAIPKKNGKNDYTLLETSEAESV